jgi:hypothetical protein
MYNELELAGRILLPLYMPAKNEQDWLVSDELGESEDDYKRSDLGNLMMPSKTQWRDSMISIYNTNDSPCIL